MSLNIETTQGLERRVTITVPAEAVEKATREEFKRAAKNVRVDGFRKGHVPAHIIEQRFGASIRQDVLNDLLPRHFFDAVIAEKINIAGRPTFAIETFEPGKDLSFTATFEVYPEVELKGLENIKVEKPTVEITEADIDKMIEVLRKQQATWVESKAAAKADSRVTIDFVGSVDGEEFEGGKATDFVLFMGQGRMIPGFEEGIVGHKAGEQFDINVTFPAEYHSENLKGKDAKFVITLKKVEEMELPELTDEFVAKFGPNTKTVADLRAEIRKNMERELKNALVSRVKQQVINGLIEQNPIDVPAEVELKGLENIKVEKPTVEITEADIDKMIEVLRKQQATWVESKAAAKADSRVTIDFVGSVDGEEFEGGKATDFVLFMGQGRMIPGFEEGIVGHKAGEQFDINVTFPAEYHSENLKGKDAKFVITLKKVEEMELPELTDEFVAKFGPNTKTVADLRAEIRKNMERELKNALVSRVKQQVINGLIEQNPIDVPASAVEEEINVLRNQAAQRFGGNAQQAAQLPRELFEADAKRRVQVGLLFSEVIKSNELKADEERAKAMIADIASAYEQPAEVVEYYSKNEELMNNIRNVVLEEQAVDAVLAKAQVTEKASSFDEIMNPQA